MLTFAYLEIAHAAPKAYERAKKTLGNSQRPSTFLNKRDDVVKRARRILANKFTTAAIAKSKHMVGLFHYGIKQMGLFMLCEGQDKSFPIRKDLGLYGTASSL